MFLNFSFLDISEITNTAKPQLQVGQYDTIKLHGNGTFKKLWGRHIDVPTSELEALTLETYIPTWDINTYMLANFNGSLSNGTVEYITSDITHWLIYRKDNDSNILKFIERLSIDQIFYLDYLVTKNNKYTYYIFAANDDEISAPLIADETLCDYWGWFLVDADNARSFEFDSNFDGGSLTAEENYTEYQNNTQFSVFNRSKHNAFAGQIQAIIWNSNSTITFEQGNQILAQLREFIHSGRTAYLKDRRGRMWQVFLYGYVENQLDNRIKEQIISCTFSFKQIGNEYRGDE